MIPNLFSKEAIPEKLPSGMEKIVEELKKSKSKEECVERAYSAISEKYRGYRVKTYLRLFDLFVSDVEKIWAKSGFIHCHTMNYLMRILLVKSGWFEDSDVRVKWTLVWYISPHQYLDVKIDEKAIIIDLWGKTYGIKLGDYAHGFH